MIPDSLWDKYLKKYNLLLWKIARRISGDIVTANIEDNRQDLEVAALDSIRGYLKKNSITIEQFIEDNHLDSKLFDQYTKTVLWHHKGKKGKNLTLKMPFRNSLLSTSTVIGDSDSSTELIETLPDKKFSSDFTASSLNIESWINIHNPIVLSLVEAIIDDPSMVTENGRLIESRATRKLGITKTEFDEAVKYLFETLK